jgi:hypothetical protein
MTPTLKGRWQTRLLLYLVIGLPITLLVSLSNTDWKFPPAIGLNRFQDPFTFITAILLLGLVLDILYIQIQSVHWDDDWPFAYQFFFSILEFFIVYGAMRYGLLDALFPGGRIPFSNAAWHFSFVFLLSFLALLGGIQIFMVRWRFHGGEVGRHPPG